MLQENNFAISFSNDDSLQVVVEMIDVNEVVLVAYFILRSLVYFNLLRQIITYH